MISKYWFESIFLNLKTWVRNIEVFVAPPEKTQNHQVKYIVIGRLVRLVSATFRNVLEYSVGGKYSCIF